MKILQVEFKRFVEEHKTELESLKQNMVAAEGKSFDSGNFSVAFIRKLIADAIKLYDADKTGKVDFALESGGELSCQCLIFKLGIVRRWGIVWKLNAWLRSSYIS